MFSIENLMNLKEILENFICQHPVYTVLALLILYLLYKVIMLDEMITDFKVEIPKQVRQVPGQKMPPNYPNGWIPVLESRFLKPNQVKSVLVFGQELAVVRGGAGLVYVLDAYCPHLGANLAVGGTVHRDASCDQDCLRCPFHGWSFRMDDGRCAEIPYEDEPVNAKVKLWPSLEVNNVIFVWYHADDQPPTWTLKPLEPIRTGSWRYRGRSEHLVNCHMQEIPENGADFAHFNELHSDSVLFGSNLAAATKARPYRILEYLWKTEWSACSPPDQHMYKILVRITTKLLQIPLFSVTFNVTQIGPAYVEFHFKAHFLGTIEGVFVQFVRPIGPMRNALMHNLYSSDTLLGWIFGKFTLIGVAKMVERDTRIWNRKGFLSKPYLTKAEKSLAQFRRWYGQFYSESSKCSLDW